MATAKFLVPVPDTRDPSQEAIIAAVTMMADANSKAELIECDPTPFVPTALQQTHATESGSHCLARITVGMENSDPGYPDLSNLTTKKIPHKDMVLDGLSSACGCCGQPLTDALSQQRSIGPDCSRKGYSEDPVDGDEMDAFICLAEFQELIEFLTEHYKPLGIRGLVNGLVRVASLNRPHGTGKNSEGNEKLFRACCEAIEALGYRKMAEVLRNVLVVAWLDRSDQPGEDGISYLRTKAYRTPGWLWSEIMNKVGGVSWDKKTRTFRIPVHEKGSPLIFCSSMDFGKSNKRVVWETLLRAFEGAAVKIDGRPVKIKVKDAS